MEKYNENRIFKLRKKYFGKKYLFNPDFLNYGSS